MPRIDRLSVQGFRSFGPEVEILEFAAPLSVIWGANSEGKTSLAEAIEFLFTGDIARRQLLSSALDEFENALRNAHLPAHCETYVEAAILGSDGATHTVRRTLLEDFTKRKVCTSRLLLDGVEASEHDLRNVGIPLSEPPLAAPVLMQHTLGYLFSANPKERASYFKSVLEVTDLDDVRDALRAVAPQIPVPPQPHRRRVETCRSTLPKVREILAPLASGMLDVTQVESAVVEAGTTLLSEVGATPSEAFSGLLGQLETMTTEKQAETFPLHGFKRSVQGVQWSPPGEEIWADIESYGSALVEVELETQRTIALLRQVLELPAVEDSAGDLDCPVCETPAALTRERIQAIRDKVRDAEGFRVAETKAKQALATLSSSIEALGAAATNACPNFFNWNRARRIAEGFRTNRLAPLLDDEAGSLLEPWFRTTAKCIRTRRSVQRAVAAAASAVSAARSDLSLLSDTEAIRQKIAPLASACVGLTGAIADYKLRTDPLERPLRDAVAKESDTTGWAELIAIGRGASEIVSESREIAAHAELLVELETACRQVEVAKESVLQDRFDDLAADVRSWWDLLRPGEAAFFSDLGLRKRAQRTIDLKAGLSPSTDQQHPKVRHAVAVFSQSQLHCLGLATFFARTSSGDDFVILDDPIVAIDDDYSVHFITAVLAELQSRNVQVIMLTHNQKTWSATQNRYDDGRCEAFQLHLNDPVEGTTVLKSSDRLAASLKACEPFTTSSVPEHRKDGCQRIRDCAERFCKEFLVQERRKQGDASALLSDYTGAGGMLAALIAPVTPYLASDEPGKLKTIRDLTNPGNHDDDIPSREGLKVCLGDLKALKKKYLN